MELRSPTLCHLQARTRKTGGVTPVLGPGIWRSENQELRCLWQKTMDILLSGRERIHLPWPFCSIQAPNRFPGGASGKEPACQCRRHKRHWFDPWVRKIPWRRKWQPTPVFLPGEFQEQRSLAGYSARDCRRVRHSWAHTHLVELTFLLCSLVIAWFSFMLRWIAFYLDLGVLVNLWFLYSSLYIYI